MSAHVSPVRRTLAVAALSAVSATASAQDATRPLQISAEYSALGLAQESGEGTGVSGVGVRVDYRLTRRIDVEGRALWFPTQALQEFEAQGGRTGQFGAGVRGRFVTAKGASVYGLLLPELLHFSNAIVDLGGPDITAGGTAPHISRWIGDSARRSRRPSGGLFMRISPARFI